MSYTKHAIVWSTVLVCVLVLTIAIAVFSSSAPVHSDYTIRMLQVWHRHGARTPVSPDGGQTCSTSQICGTLTKQGMLQMNAVGEYVHMHYGSNSLLPVYNSSLYMVNQVLVNASHFDRTIQSSQAMMSKMYSSNENFYPVINTIERDIDMILNIDNIPAVRAMFVKTPEGTNPIFNTYAFEKFTMEELQGMGIESSMGNICTDVRTAIWCASFLFDVAVSMEAEGTLSSAPLLKSSIDRLYYTQNRLYRAIFIHNESDALRLDQGSMGQIAAQQILKSINDWTSNGQYPMQIFSTHDTNLISLSMTLGDTTESSLLPKYATTLFVELLESKVDASLHVRVQRGEPTAAPDNISNFSFHLNNFTQHCMSANGKTYTAEICPVDDFARFINSTKPKAKAGLCALAPEAMALLGCPTLASPGGALPQNCLQYRRNCPAWSCGENEILSADDYQCYPTFNDKLPQQVTLKRSAGHYASAFIGMPVLNYVMSKF